MGLFNQPIHCDVDDHDENENDGDNHDGSDENSKEKVS